MPDISEQAQNKFDCGRLGGGNYIHRCVSD